MFGSGRRGAAARCAGLVAPCQLGGTNLWPLLTDLRNCTVRGLAGAYVQQHLLGNLWVLRNAFLFSISPWLQLARSPVVTFRCALRVVVLLRGAR